MFLTALFRSQKMISNDIKSLIALTENFIAVADPDRDFSHNLRNLSDMLKASNVSEMQAVLPANLATNSGAIAVEIANKFANCGRKI
jgi:hypothetical protein